MSPGFAYRRIRLERAHWLVEHMLKSMAEIAYECGFADASHLRALRETFGVSPRAMRSSLMRRGIPEPPDLRSILPIVTPD